MTPTTAPAPLGDFDSKKVLEFFTPERLATLKGISNGRFNEHLQAACRGSAGLTQSVLSLIKNCGGKVTDDERVKLGLKDEARVVKASPAKPSADAKKP